MKLVPVKTFAKSLGEKLASFSDLGLHCICDLSKNKIPPR